MLALDAKNAFNSANWGRIKGALANITISGYLASLVENYFLTLADEKAEVVSITNRRNKNTMKVEVG